MIIAWCCKNSISDNENLLLQYSNLGWKHTYSKVEKKPHREQIKTGLEDMYSAPLTTKSVSELNKEKVKNKNKTVQEHSAGRHICQIIDEYGRTVMRQVGTLDDACER